MGLNPVPDENYNDNEVKLKQTQTVLGILIHTYLAMSI